MPSTATMTRPAGVVPADLVAKPPPQRRGRGGGQAHASSLRSALGAAAAGSGLSAPEVLRASGKRARVDCRRRWSACPSSRRPGSRDAVRAREPMPEIAAPLDRVVRRQRAGPAVAAARIRRLGHAGERVHAAADAGEPRDPPPRGVARPVADPVGSRGGCPARGGAAVGEPRLPAARAVAAPRGRRDPRPARRRRAERRGRAPRADRHRRLHGARGGGVRLRRRGIPSSTRTRGGCSPARSTAGRSRARRHGAISRRWPTILPADDATVGRRQRGRDGAGSDVCTARAPRCDACPVADRCAWRAAGYPDTGDERRRQARYEGSDRQARGAVLKTLRDAAAHAVPLDEVRARLAGPAPARPGDRLAHRRRAGRGIRGDAPPAV